MALVPASDTGAVEMALWNLLGPRGVDVLAFEAFSQDWVIDIVERLKLDHVRVLTAPYGDLPDLTQVDFERDVVFAWNGTTSGVRVPGAGWIAVTRKGLVICDAISAVFPQNIDWEKLDVVTYSWQKVLRGEAQHGMLILSPRALARLESFEPAWPVPKLFRLTKNGKVIEDLFEGGTINTPSMLCLEDYMDTLSFIESIGGVDGAIARADANAAAIADFVARTPWLDFLAASPKPVPTPLFVFSSRTRTSLLRAGAIFHERWRTAWRRKGWPTTSPRIGPPHPVFASGPVPRSKRKT